MASQQWLFQHQRFNTSLYSIKGKRVRIRFRDTSNLENAQNQEYADQAQNTLLFIAHIERVLVRYIIKLFREEKLKNISNLQQTPNREQSIHRHLLIPLYNYLIKLTANQELYNICKTQIVPCNQIFRKGSKIRFIWVFKIYNLINLVLPILSPCTALLEQNQKDNIYTEILEFLNSELRIYICFINKCISQTIAKTNPLLMPYNQCLQYFQCLREYNLLKQKLMRISLKSVIEFIQINSEDYNQIQILSMRIQLISASLRNNNSKQNQQLATEYNQKAEIYYFRLQTESQF